MASWTCVCCYIKPYYKPCLSLISLSQQPTTQHSWINLNHACFWNILIFISFFLLLLLLQYQIFPYCGSLRFIISYGIVSYHDLSYHNVLYLITSYHSVPYLVTCYHTILHCILSYGIVLYHIASYCIILYRNTGCYPPTLCIRQHE